MAEENVTRKLAAILYADVAGYSRLTDADEIGTHRMVAEHLDSIAEIVARHGGNIVHYAGDAVLADFFSAVSAVNCAIEVQLEFAARNATVEDDRRVLFRIGVNLGDVIVDRNDIFGNGVNIAARLESLADPGGICISQKVLLEIEDAVEAAFEDMGPQEVKNIARPVQAYRVQFGQDREKSYAPIVSDRPSIAVLPFTNPGGDQEQDYFSDGLTDDLITALSRFRDLSVMARNSTFVFKDAPIDLASVSQKLGVKYVIEGSVRKSGGRVRVTAKLLEAETGVNIWADRFDRNIEDIFDVQDEVTQSIAANLGVRLQDAALEKSLRKRPEDLDAYERVLQARRYTEVLDPEAHAAARDLLERAVEIEPGYGEAHALLANIYLAEHRFGHNPQSGSLERALRTARRAVELDPRNARARCWLAIVHYFLGETEAFKAEANRALALNPNDPEVAADIGHYMAFMGTFEYGTQLTRRAMRLNPLHPGWYHFSFARRAYHKGDYEEALREVEKINMPHFYWMQLLRAAVLGQLGLGDEAAGALARLKALKPGVPPQEEFVKWNTDPHDKDHLMEGLRKAGLRG